MGKWQARGRMPFFIYKLLKVLLLKVSGTFFLDKCTRCCCWNSKKQILLITKAMQQLHKIVAQIRSFKRVAQSSATIKKVAQQLRKIVAQIVRFKKVAQSSAK